MPLPLSLHGFSCNRQSHQQVMNRTFFSYRDIENMLERFVAPLRERQCEVVVAILRGGLFPAHFLANELGLPMRFIQLDRDSGTPTMLGDVSGQRVLLVDDSCCTGRTMAPCKVWLEARGCEVITCAIFAVRPVRVDFAVEAEPSPAQEWVVPWERRVFTPGARALGGDGKYLPMNDAHLSFYAWDLDGIFVPDLAREEYEADLQDALARRDDLPPLDRIPAIDFRNAAIVSARPIVDASRTRRWWARHFPLLPMYFRDDRQYGNSPEEVARYKTEAALALGATHFVESDLHIATLIAVRAPMLRVQWFDRKTHTAIAISAWEMRHAGTPAAHVRQGVLSG
ncbi:MAG: phosphoribosyltransferase [Herminiimonas sp.]|nr:phosphoribosyltransferase [Herminiimonas sp.]